MASKSLCLRTIPCSLIFSSVLPAHISSLDYYFLVIGRVTQRKERDNRDWITISSSCPSHHQPQRLNRPLVDGADNKEEIKCNPVFFGIIFLMHISWTITSKYKKLIKVQDMVMHQK